MSRGGSKKVLAGYLNLGLTRKQLSYIRREARRRGGGFGMRSRIARELIDAGIDSRRENLSLTAGVN